MKNQVSKSEQIRNLYDAGKSVKEIKAKVGCSHALIAIVLRNYKAKKKKSKIVKAVTEVKQALDAIEKKPKVYKSLDGTLAWFESKPKKLIVRPEHKDAAMKLLAATDLVNHPPHYKTGGVETIDFIEAKDLNYRLGNVVKYVSRAGKKGDPLQDLEKAAWYLQREITARKNA